MQTRTKALNGKPKEENLFGLTVVENKSKCRITRVHIANRVSVQLRQRFVSLSADSQSVEVFR